MEGMSRHDLGYFVVAYCECLHAIVNAQLPIDLDGDHLFFTRFHMVGFQASIH